MCLIRANSSSELIKYYTFFKNLIYLLIKAMRQFEHTYKNVHFSDKISNTLVRSAEQIFDAIKKSSNAPEFSSSAAAWQKNV